MLIRDTGSCLHERVLDHSLLCELLHPDKVDGAGHLPCSIAHAIVPVGEETLPHRLSASTELYYILKGTGEMRIGAERATVGPGQMILIPPQSIQQIRNIGKSELEFLCIVTPKWQAADEELVPE